jgi:hypothetical protein
MTRGLALMWGAVSVLAGGAVTVTSLGYVEARAVAERRLSTYRDALAQTKELTQLRAKAPAWTRRGRPPTGLTPRISAALTSCGLPASSVASVSPESESALGETDLHARRTRAVVTLTGVTLPQLGNFLGAWRAREPAWTVASIDLSPQNGQGAAGSGSGSGAGGDLPLRAVIGIETMFVDQGGGR